MVPLRASADAGFAGKSADLEPPAQPVAVEDADSGEPKLPSDVDDVREAAFRYMFRKNASGLQQSASLYCIEIEQKSPSAALLRRLRDVRPRVVSIDACDADAEHGVTEKRTGKAGLIFSINGIVWLDADHAEVGGGYYEGGLSSSGNTYYAERKNGRWVIVRDVMHWIS